MNRILTIKNIGIVGGLIIAVLFSVIISYGRVTNQPSTASIPSSSTDNAVVRWDGASGVSLQDSGVTIDDSDNLIFAGADDYIEFGDTDTRLSLDSGFSGGILLDGVNGSSTPRWIAASGDLTLYSSADSDGSGTYAPYITLFSSGFADISGTKNFRVSNVGLTDIFQVINTTDATTTAVVGATGIPACLEIWDTDGSGITYVTTLNGVLTATGTRPTICN